MRTCLAAALLLIGAQEQSPQPPTFKSGVNVVEVDVVALDSQRKPVRGLRETDFEIFEDGEPVPIVTFEAVDLPQAPPGQSVPAVDGSGTSLASNDQAEDGRVLLIVMDDHHVRLGGSQFVTAKVIARRVVERLGRFDQAAIIATSGRSIMQAEFTADKARLLEAIDNFFPQADGGASGAEVDAGLRRGLSAPSGSFGFERELRARLAMDTLSNAAKALALIPRRRKAIVLVSEGLPASVEQIVSDLHASSAWQSVRDFIETAQRSNVAVYPVDPCGLGVECSTAAQENLRALGETTGGFAVVNTNAPEERVEQILAESGTYYLIGYASPAAQDGRRHRIRVRSRVPGVEIRAREGYVSARASASPAPGGPPGDRLIAAPIQSRGLTMRVTAVPAPLASSPGAVIVLGIEVHAKSALQAKSVDFTVAAVNPATAKVLVRQRFTNTFQATGSTAEGWARLRTHLPLQPGRYLVRVAAVGQNNAAGSVFTEVTVPNFEGPLVLGGLSIAESAARPDSVNAKDAQKALPLTPLATREIKSGVPVVVEVPVRLNARAVSGPLVLAATLRSADRSPLEFKEEHRDLSRYATAMGAIHRVTIPQDLPAGSYALTVQATAGRARVTRELAFRVNEPE